MASNVSEPVGSPLVKWTAPGLLGGMMFAMFAMIVAIFTSTFWAPPQGIAQAIGIGPDGHDFHVVPFLLGLLGHMMNSVILGAIFLAIVRARRPASAITVVGGMVYGLVVYAVMYWVLLRHLLSLWAAQGVTSFLTSNPEWSWVVGHLIFGMVLGLLVAYGLLRIATATTPKLETRPAVR